ncbi:hypothetical protein F5Y03DRAFT_401225 [Xylaria venustula]|nr:hypothetical protein F5Y03DRAFT_401225 [Xylaria venustula]
MAKIRAAYDARPVYHPTTEKEPQDSTPGELRTTAREPGRTHEPGTSRSKSPVRRGHKRANTGDVYMSGDKENEPNSRSSSQRPIRIRTLSRRALGEINGNTQTRQLSSQHMDLTTNLDQ